MIVEMSETKVMSTRALGSMFYDHKGVGNHKHVRKGVGILVLVHEGIENVVYVRKDIGKVGDVRDSFGDATRGSRSWNFSGHCVRLLQMK